MRTLVLLPLAFFLGCSSSSSDDNDPDPVVDDTLKGFQVNNCEMDRSLIHDGGPPKDGIPAILQPRWMPLTSLSTQVFPFSEEDKVLVVEMEGEERAYPERLLWFHEIINDTLGGVDFAISYCPLTGSTVAFKRSSNETFRVSGLLHESNLMMYDTSSESLWPQMDFGASCGNRKSESLDFFGVKELNMAALNVLYPEIDFVFDDSRTDFNYSQYPYGNYDQIENESLLFPVSALDESYPIKSLCLMVFEGDSLKGYPHPELSGVRVVNDQIEGKPYVVVFEESGQYANAFKAELDGSALLFEVFEDELYGELTSFVMQDASGSIWNLKGECIEGENQGRVLQQANNMNAMWFSFKISFPEAEVYQTL